MRFYYQSGSGTVKTRFYCKIPFYSLHFFKAMDPNEWTLSNADLLQSVATLSWINDQHNSDMLQKVLAARVGYSIMIIIMHALTLYIHVHLSPGIGITHSCTDSCSALQFKPALIAT